MDQNPFTIRDAKCYLYAQDALGVVGAAVYLGPPEVETATFETTYELKREEYHGDPDWVARQVNREHAVELRNVWAHLVDSAGKSHMPEGWTQHATYCLVVVWYDPELGIWHKRSYYGARAVSHRVEDSFQTLRYTSPRLVRTQGYSVPTTAPDPLEDELGFVMYRSTTEELALYNYLDGIGFLATDTTAGRATIVATAGVLEVRFNGTLAMRVTEFTIDVHELVAIGGTFVNTLPRLEFFMGTTRVASLSAAGVLAVVNFTEADTDPDTASGMRLLDGSGAWLATFGLPTSTAPGIEEGL